MKIKEESRKSILQKVKRGLSQRTGSKLQKLRMQFSKVGLNEVHKNDIGKETLHNQVMPLFFFFKPVEENADLG